MIRIRRWNYPGAVAGQFSKIVLSPAYGLATAPTGVLIGSPAGHRLVSIGLGGVVQVNPPLRTHKLYLLFSGVSSSAAGVPANGQPAQLPVGLASVSVPGLTGLHVAAPAASTPFQLSCGSGPPVTVNGHVYQTSVSGTVGNLIELQPVKLGLCTPGGGELTLGAGRQTLAAKPSDDFTITDLTLSSQPSQLQRRPPVRTVKVRPGNPTTGQCGSRPGPASYLEIHENSNPGWIATLNGRKLTQPRSTGGSKLSSCPLAKAA